MKDDLARDLMSWLEIDSVTPGERAFLERLERDFVASGWEARRQDVAPDRWNVVFTRPGDPDPRLLYSTHVDTVPPHLPVRREGDLVYGRGACDTKGGLLAMWRAAERLLDAGHAGVGFLLVVGEEVDHRGARVAHEAGLTPERIILCEPTRNLVVAAQKGMIKLDWSAEGVAAHSAYPERGDSALHRAIGACHALLGHGWPSDPLLGPTTVNVGQASGGVAANVFAPSAQGNALIRTVAPTADYLDGLDACFGPHRVTHEVVVENGPVFFDPPEGFETCTVAFNTDATYLNRVAPVWLVGPGDIEVAHTDHEHIDLGELAAGVDLYVRLGEVALGVGAQGTNVKKPMDVPPSLESE